jgi:hypothetical protein
MSDVYKRAFDKAHAEYAQVKARLADKQAEKAKIERDLILLDRVIKALENMLESEKPNVQS